MLFSLDVSILPSVRLIGRVVYTEPWIHFSRQANEFILYVMKKGELYITEENCRYCLKQGDILLLEPNKNHAGYKMSVCDYYFIHFKHPKLFKMDEPSEDKLIEEMSEKRRQSLLSYSLDERPFIDPISYLPKYYHLANENEYLPLLQEAVVEYQRKYEHYKELVSSRILDLMNKICREYVTVNIESTNNHISKSFIKAHAIIDYLNREYYKKITSSDIEQLMESNYDYLNRVFHKATGFSIFHYLNMVRINKAKEIMETTSMKFSDIGYLIGIDNPYYFSKLFKKYSGMTPTQYWEMVNRV